MMKRTVAHLKKWLEQFPDEYYVYTDVHGVIGVTPEVAPDPEQENQDSDKWEFDTWHGIDSNLNEV